MSNLTLVEVGAPPGIELASDSAKLTALETGLEVFRGALEGLAHQGLPLLVLAPRPVSHRGVPQGGKVCIRNHAILELVTGLKLESGGDNTGIEVSYRVGAAKFGNIVHRSFLEKSSTGEFYFFAVFKFDNREKSIYNNHS